MIVDYVDNPEGAENTKRNIEEAAGKCEIVLAGVSRIEDECKLFGIAWSRLGAADILVNKVGKQHKDDCWNATDAEYDMVMAVNLRGRFFLMQAFVRLLRDAGKPGRVVNISPVDKDMAFPGFANDC